MYCPPDPLAQVSGGAQSLREAELVDRLLHLLASVEANAEPLSVGAALLLPPPPPRSDDDSRLPLTW